MHPVYMWGGPYPYHAHPTHYAANDDPRAKEISSHMKMDPNPASITSPYQPWPYAGNHWYPGPQECHGGYNQGCFGGPYGFQPPYPYYPPPPPPYHSHGFHPPFPGAYPAYSYSIPPPHYSVEQPRYDYDKNVHGSRHCCGCNHREDEKKSMVKQVEPEIEKKTSNSLIPFLMKDYPYPIMWVPPGFVNNESNAQEKEKHTHDRVPLNESKEKEKEKHTHDHVPFGPLEPSKQRGNGETERKQPGGDDSSLPFPIFWFPYKNNEVGEENVKESPSARSDDKKRQTKINNEAESDTGIKPLVQKVIPVKQMGSEEEMNRPKNIKTKTKSDSVEKTDIGNEGKASPKTPKLPPVCLRVDPLPRKKSTSRSPSPPSDKIRSKGSTINESRSCQQQQKTQLSDGLKKSNEEQNVKTVKVVESDSVGDRCENVSNGSEKGIVCKAEKKLSENEAALIIQSAYRGFQVRKSKPITKLRQIAEVGRRVIELKNRVHDLESSFFDNKEKVVIGETIMSLLLKLDTIQGLHPAVREVRKCVAKELVGLQEKLDSLKPESPNEEDTTKGVKNDDDGSISETQLDGNQESGIINGKNDTSVEPQMELQNDVNDKQPLDDDVIQDDLGGKDDDEKSETQSHSNVESAMINGEDGTYVDEESSGELNKDQQLLDDVKLPQADGNGESGGRADEKEQKVAEDNSKGEMSEQAADAIQAESGTNVKPQSTEEVAKNQMETDTAAESGTNVKPQIIEAGTKNQMETDTAAESGTSVEPQTTKEVTKNEMESDTAAESGTNVEPQSTEEVTKNQMQSDTPAESGTNAEQQSTMEVTKNGMESDTAAESGTNVKPQSREEVTKNQVEMLSDEENVGVDVQSEEKPKEEDSVKATVEVVKEQMDVIRELTAKVKDLEKKLLKNKNNNIKKKMKKANKECEEDKDGKVKTDP
ncbi:hypothetical protein OSB04_010607, partial [Centaurea solstitialis]